MSTIGWIGLGLSAIWLAYHLWDEYIRANPGDGKGGFLDYLKHPERFGGLRLDLCPGNAFPLPNSDDPAAWDACVCSAVEQRWDTFEYHRMESRDPRLGQAALRVLADTEFVGRAWPTEKDSLPYWNLSALANLFPAVIPADAVPLLESFLTHENKWCRKAAGQVLGKVDDPRAASRIRAILRGDDRDLHEGVTYGLSQVTHDRPSTDGLIRELWDDLYDTIADGRMNYQGITGIIRRMILADEQAAARLLDPSFLRWDLKNLDNVLHGLRIAGVTPIRQHLLELVRQWRVISPSKEHSAYSRACVIAECLLQLTAKTDGDERTELSTLIECLLEDADPEMRGRAAPAYLALHGIVVDPAHTCYQVVFETKGILTPAQSDYWEVTQLVSEV